MKRTRKPYRQRAVIVNPLTMLRRASPSARARVMLGFYTALESIARGQHPGVEEWRSLSDAVNTIETLATRMRKLPADLVMPMVNAAIVALVDAAGRYQRGERLGFTGPDLQAVRGVVALYDECLEALSELDMALAQQYTQERVSRLMRSVKPSHEIIAL